MKQLINYLMNHANADYLKSSSVQNSSDAVALEAQANTYISTVRYIVRNVLHDADQAKAVRSMSKCIKRDLIDGLDSRITRQDFDMSIKAIKNSGRLALEDRQQRASGIQDPDANTERSRSFQSFLDRIDSFSACVNSAEASVAVNQL